MFVGIPALVALVMALPETIQLCDGEVSPNSIAPTVTGEPKVTVESAVRSSVLKSATASVALGTVLVFQFAAVPQSPEATPPTRLVHVAARAGANGIRATTARAVAARKRLVNGIAVVVFMSCSLLIKQRRSLHLRLKT